MISLLVSNFKIFHGQTSPGMEGSMDGTISFDIPTLFLPVLAISKSVLGRWGPCILHNPYNKPGTPEIRWIEDILTTNS